MAGETNVTIAAARFLGALGWKVLSIALPRGGSGLSFVGNDEKYPPIIPDIVAVNEKHNKFIFIEAKPHFSNSDVEKLLKVRAGHYSYAISTILNCTSNQLLLGVAFAGRRMKSKPSTLGVDYVFYYAGDGKVEVLHDGVELGV